MDVDMNNFEDEKEEDELIDQSGDELKADHMSRPIWISNKKNYIFLESFSPLYQPATDFLIAISQPVSRPTHIHKYQLTKHSLYAAVSVELYKEDIVKVLDRLCKNKYIPQNVIDFIDE